MKICFKCRNEKPLSDYYKHKKMTDGHLNKCKNCTKNDVKKAYIESCNDPLFIEKERERGRNKYHRLYATLEKKTSKKSSKDFRQNFPEKYKAHISAQRITKIAKSNHNHHWSYLPEYWKDVIELDVKSHNLAHRHLIYDQEHFLYRTLSNELLDTKVKHINYLESYGIEIYNK